MHTLGSEFIPPGFHAGGLRYHGMAPLVSHCKELGLIEARAYHQNPCFEAGVMFARAEGIVPAPETNHAVRAAVDEALKAREEGKSPTILFNLSGHGHFDMQAYTDYFAGTARGSGLRSGRSRGLTVASAQGGGGITPPSANRPAVSGLDPGLDPGMVRDHRRRSNADGAPKVATFGDFPCFLARGEAATPQNRTGFG